MSRPSPFVLMAQNWRKSIVYVVVGGGGLGWYWDYTITKDMMQNSCRRATSYGDEKLANPKAPVRHITVILNPVANKRKAKKLYEKWVEPLFHLAGIKVSLIETQRSNQAFDLMTIMSNCDGVAIVGGDGTVHEALNGLLSRPDCTKAVKDFPIGIIPAGQHNSIARYVHQNYLHYRNQKEFLIAATMRVVDSCTQKYDVLKVNPLDEELAEQKAHDAPIYALRDIRYGIYQDNFYKISGFTLYQSYVKPIWLRLQRTFGSSSKYPHPRIEKISYTEPCEGCTTCCERHKLREPPKPQDPAGQTQEEPSSGANKKWWGMIAPMSKTSPELSEEEKREIELSKRTNPECQRWIDVGAPGEISDFRACMMGDKKVRLSLGRQREYNPSDVTETQDVRLKVAVELDQLMKQSLAPEVVETPEQSQSTDSDEKQQHPTKGEQEKPNDTKKTDKVEFLIDGEPLQAHSVEVTALSKAVTLFTGPHKFRMTEPSKKKKPRNSADSDRPSRRGR